MNISISGSEITNMYDIFNNYIKKASIDGKQLHEENSGKSSEINDISYAAKLQYKYSNEIKGSNKPCSDINAQGTFLPADSIDPLFIENYALKYASMKVEISKEYPEKEAQEKISLLDKAYDDAVNEAAQSLADDFQKFFDYADSEWIYNKEDTPKFDREAFKNNILALADKSLSVVKEAFKEGNFDNLQEKVEAELSNTESGTSIESMSYRDIRGIDEFLKSIPNFKNRIREYRDDGTYKAVQGNWTLEDAISAINKEYAMTLDLVKSGKVSASTSDYVYSTVMKNVDAYRKRFAFTFQQDEYQKEINKDNNYYKLLKAQYEKYEKKLEEAKKQNSMKMVFIYLKLLSQLKDNLQDAALRIKEDTETKDKLSKDPNSVVDIDAYKTLKNSENFKEEDIN